MKQELKLVEVSEKYFPELLSYKQEFLDSGESMDGCGPLKRYDDMQAYLDRLNCYLDPKTVPEGMVVTSHFLCIRKSDERVVGMIQIRHCFNAYFEKYAGHIGYSVRPSERLKGYATWMLANILPFCRSIKLNRVLVCCPKGNTGSQKTIRNNGGIYEKTVYLEARDVFLERYWIEILD